MADLETPHMKSLALSLSFILLACGASASSDPAIALEDSQLQSALEADAGGFSEDAEDPTPAVAAEESAELDEGEANADPDPAMPPELLPEEAARGAYFVRIAWGNFPVNRSNAKNVVDYSGSLTVDADDGLRRVRAWHFEPRDQIERPRTSKSAIAFASHITVASDGLHMLVLTSEGASTLTVNLGGEGGAPVQFEKSYTLDPATHLREANPSATAGQEVRIAIDRIEKPADPECADGTLVGRWNKRRTPNGRDLFVLVGRVLSDDGKVIAKVGGIAGVRKNGEHVWFMKIVGRGRLVGLMKGTYDPAAKTFTGTVYGRGRVEAGSVSGTYTDTTTFEGALDLTACGH